MDSKERYIAMLKKRDYRIRKGMLKVRAIMTEAKNKIKDKEGREAIQPALNILEQIKEK